MGFAASYSNPKLVYTSILTSVSIWIVLENYSISHLGPYLTVTIVLCEFKCENSLLRNQRIALKGNHQGATIPCR